MTPPSTPRRWRLLIAGALACCALVLLLAVDSGPILRTLEGLRELGPWGPVCVIGLYVVATVLFVPGWVLTVASGFAFGLVEGTVTASIGSVLGASAAFAIGRRLARAAVQSRLSRSARWSAVDRAVARHGFKVVVLTRLSPAIPFNLLSYGLGLTRIPFRHYLLASWLAMLPGTVLYVWIGSAAVSIVEVAEGERPRGAAENVLLVVGLMATALLIAFLTRLARRALRAELDDAEPN